MKKLIALLLALCLLLPFAAFGEDAAATEDAVATEDAAQETGEPLSVHEVRYYFEHRLLPQLLFEDADQLLGFILENSINQLWLNFIADLDFVNPYTADDFNQSIVYQTENAVIVRADLPKPEDSPLCLRVYFYYDFNADIKAYFTVEYDNFFGESWFLCEWTQEGVHNDYGTIDTVKPADADDYAESLEREVNGILYIIENNTAPAGYFDPAGSGK